MKRLLIVALMLVSVPVLAQDAWEHISKGQRHVQSGRLVQALNSFKQAIALDPRNGTALNAAGQVATFLELPDEAVFFYQAYLYVEAEYMGDGEAVRKEMEKQLAKMKEKATLKIKVTPDSGEILVNGVTFGRGSVSLPVAPTKEYVVSVSVVAVAPFQQAFTLNNGQEKVVNIKLNKIIYNGKVMLKVLPAEDVKVYVDTKYVGNSISEVQTNEGRRLLCFKKEGYDRWWRYVSVPRNEATNLEVNLRPESRPNESCESWPEEEGY